MSLNNDNMLISPQGGRQANDDAHRATDAVADTDTVTKTRNYPVIQLSYDDAIKIAARATPFSGEQGIDDLTCEEWAKKARWANEKLENSTMCQFAALLITDQLVGKAKRATQHMNFDTTEEIITSLETLFPTYSHHSKNI
ncbi:hypothetical protein H4219_006330 [Mycoemilia scoparia]|uniref:Uncharacterized protein n=1 Tax=Mycoemilia scoparia TaxID=417184 RepID=A0A9W8DM85_9FUNG|nr:hypothetical protein H4219_006330 [Mycoemilia scoparia]